MKVLLFYGFPSVQKSLPTLEPGRKSFFRSTRSLLMYNRLLVEIVLHETCLLTILHDSSVSYDVVFSLSCHPLKFILIVTIFLTTLKTCTHLSCSCLVQSACFLWKQHVFWDRLQNHMRILNLEHTVNVTAVFTCLDNNDNDPVNGVLSSSVGVNHMLDEYLFRKTDLEYGVTDLEYSVDAHPFETNMKLQG